MKILFTQSEYRALLDLVYIGEWMLTAFDEAADPKKAKYEHVVQKIYSHAKEMGYESLIEVFEEGNVYVPTDEYEEKSGIHDVIQRYDDDTFWTELTDRLVERDVFAAAEGVEKLSDDEYWKRAAPIEQKYSREFTKHGVDRLKVDEST